MLAVAALELLLLALVHPGKAQNDECMCFEEISSVNNLQSPLIFEHANDGTFRRFIGEQTGRCWIVLRNGTRLPEPFLDISDLVYQSSGYSEEGFLSLAFHPQFATNRRLYVYYSYRENNQPITRLTEMLTFVDNPNKADNNTARHLMTIPQPYTNHNGGRLMFGLDGYLYLMLGDGGSAGDPDNNAQNMLTWLGKALRIDVDTRAPGKEYGIPADNPYVGNPDALEEIYASGFRNPWRVHQDTGDFITGAGAGRIFVGDVGQDAWEEVSILTPGTDAAANYGWSAYEGNVCYDAARCQAIEGTPLIWPIHAYSHDAVGVCIIGGPVYRGNKYPFMNGINFFGDWGTGKVFYLTENAGVWTEHEVSSCPTGSNNCNTYCDPGTCTGALSSTFTGRFILTFGVDEEGEIYFGTSSSSLQASASGRVYKIHDLRYTAKK